MNDVIILLHNIIIDLPEINDDMNVKYGKVVDELETEEKREEPRNGKIKKMMKQSFAGRRRWIVEDVPTVLDVLEVFPSFKKAETVSAIKNLMK